MSMGISGHSNRKQIIIFPKEGYPSKMCKALIADKFVCPQGKRKLDQFLEVGNHTDPYKLNSDGHSYRKICKLAAEQCSPVPYLPQQGNIALNSKKSCDLKSQFSDNMENVICVTNKDPYSELPFLFRTDESTINSSYSNQENNNKNNIINPTEQLNFIDGNLKRAVIPIGPKFQAEVPEWSSQVDLKNAYAGDDNSHNLKYLGTRVWPIDGEKLEGSSSKAIGKGKPDSCSCVSRGSVDCVKHHIVEAKKILKSVLGPAFSIWKFDEIGEEISRSWTVEERRGFDSFLRSKLSHSEKSSWKSAWERFPLRSKRLIVNYYYNVYTPMRMSVLTRSANEGFSSDNDDANVVYYARDEV